MRRSRLAAAAALAFGAAAWGDVSSDRAIMDEGFDTAAGGSIHGKGIWTDPRALFRVQIFGAAHDGAGYVRVDTTEFADYNLPGFRNRWGGWVGFAQGACLFEPRSSEQSVISLRGYVRVSMPSHPNTRAVRAAIVIDDAENSAIADIGLNSTGMLDGVAVFDGNEIPWRTAEPVADASEWNEVVIRLDLTSGLGRVEWNGNQLLVFSHAAVSVSRIQLAADGRGSAAMPFASQGSADFDSVSVSASWHCQGDLNLDRVVDDADFESFARMYHRGDCAIMTILDASCAADLNLDRAVDENDFAVFSARYDNFACP
ncbi:MAG TPA: hypothetical protein VF777_11670 [Phycisphaerales bacterium]